jgi:hypothetical protein
MPRFVILEHDHPFLHWDLMLEDGASLKTWRLPAPPQADTVMRVTGLGDHRLAYLEYEGPLSGNRGQVTRWDSGTYAWLGREEDRVTVSLSGDRVRGRAFLQKAADGDWEFHFE